MATRYGGQGRVSTKTKLAGELAILGRVLARARERAGVRQSDVAARLDLPPSYLSKIENGTRRVDVVEFIRIAEAIGITPAELVNEIHDEMRKTSPAGGGKTD